MGLPDEVLDLELIDELVELAWIDPGAESTRVGLDRVPGLCILLCWRGQSTPDRLVQRLLEGQPAAVSEGLELLRQIGLEGDGCPHLSIMMLHQVAVKLLYPGEPRHVPAARASLASTRCPATKATCPR